MGIRGHRQMTNLSVYLSYGRSPYWELRDSRRTDPGFHSCGRSIDPVIASHERPSVHASRMTSPVDHCLEAPRCCGGEASVSLGIDVKGILPTPAIRRCCFYVNFGGTAVVVQVCHHTITPHHADATQAGFGRIHSGMGGTWSDI